MAKALLAIVLGVLIGAGCRWFDVPVPSPPRLLGALLVVAMTLGYMAADKMVKAQRVDPRKSASRPVSSTWPGGRRN
jgi:XapX domain-containing protein